MATLTKWQEAIFQDQLIILKLFSSLCCEYTFRLHLLKISNFYRCTLVKRVYNFSAGPAALPIEVMQHIRDEFLNWDEHGYSVIESSHRHPDYIAMTEEAEKDLRELMAIPENYKVLFASGGASFQFAGIPLNFSGRNKQVDYFHTGLWSGKAIAEARRYCNVNIVATSEADNYTRISDVDTWQFSDDAAYVFYTPNETVHGLSFPFIPDTGNVPLVSDMTSNILGEEVDVSKFGMIFAGVQKNIAPSGLTIIIVRDDLLNQAMDICPSLLNYKVIDQYHSMPNTPPTFSWYVAGLVFKWVKSQGGVAAMAAVNRRKSSKLYEAVDASDLYTNGIDQQYRSCINVPFALKDNKLNSLFLSEAEQEGIQQIKGHITLGGMRASLYNAVTEEAVDVLISFMKAFECKYG